MSRGLLIAAMVLGMFVASDAWAKKARPATQPATQPADAVETGKTRAKDYAQGKDLDKAKTGSKLDTLLGQVDLLDQKAKTQPTTQPAVRRRPRTTVPPATQPVKTDTTRK